MLLRTERGRERSAPRRRASTQMRRPKGLRMRCRRRLAPATVLLVRVERVDADRVRVVLVTARREARTVSTGEEADPRQLAAWTNRSPSPSAVSAFLQAAWNACSTLTASLAEVSK